MFQQETSASTEILIPRIEKLIEASLAKLELQSFFKTSLSEVREAITVKFQDNMNTVGARIEASIGGTNKSVQDFLVKLDGYHEGIMSSESFNDRLHEMEKQLVSLEQLKLEHITTIGTKEAQYEELDSKLQKSLIELSNYKNLERSLTEENIQLRSELVNFKDECLKLKGLMAIDQANADNKIASLNEIKSSMITEIASYKSRISELEETKMRSEQERTIGLSRLQEANEQVQKLNVELVQAKAHSLELDEQNRNLMRSINDKKCNTEEIFSELRSLKQEIIVLEADRQDVVTEKLELLDKLEELKEGSKNMKLQIAKLEEELLRVRNLKEEGKAVTCEVIEEDSLRPRQTTITKNLKRAKSKASYNREVLSSLNTNRDIQIQNDSGKRGKSMKVSTPQRKKVTKYVDEFDLSDDLELTNPSPIALGHRSRTGRERVGTSMRAPSAARKKLLIPDTSEPKGAKVQGKSNKKRKY